MARIGWVEVRLQRWAEAVTIGDGSGYPTMSVLHENWTPPAPGTLPSIKVGPSGDDVRATHRLVGQLSQRLANTVIVHYCLRLPMREQAERLGCGEWAINDRICRAHKAIAAAVCGAGTETELCNTR